MSNLSTLFDRYKALVVFDTETSGLDFDNDQIIELAALRVERTATGGLRIAGKMDTFIKLPEGETLPENIVSLTGITDERLQTEGVQPVKAAGQIAKLMQNGPTLMIAHNAQFDACFLRGLLRGQKVGRIDWLDSLTVYKDRRAYPHKLANAIIAYDLTGKVQNSHRAIDDVLALFEVLKAMDDEREDLGSYKKGVRSFWLNAFSSPWTPWEKIVLKFLDAKDDPQRLKVVYNTLLGQLWEDRGDLEDEDTMLARREDYGTRSDGTPVELPDGVLVLTCGVDTQDNRLEYEVVGHGKYGETWGVVKGYIMGRPDTPEVWQRLDDVVDHVYKFKNGRGLKISITCVDSGGHFTQEVYEACRARVGKRVFAIKGKGGDGIPFVSPPSKVPIRDNKRITCWLYTIGVDAGKATIMANLKVQEPGPKYCHFNRHPDTGYDLNFFNGLLSEKLVLTHTRRGDRWAWDKLPGHNRNEALDCRDYANAGLKIINPDMDAIERRLQGLEEKPKAPQQRRQRQRHNRADAFDDW